MKIKLVIKTVFLVMILFFLLANSFAQEHYPYKTSENRDPLNPLVNEKGELITRARIKSKDAGFNLEGIIFDDNAQRSVAVIDGQIYSQKDIVGDYSIKDISKDQVILEKEGKEKILKLEG